MFKPYPLSKYDSHAWSMAIGLPAIWAISAIFLPQQIALTLYTAFSLVWVLLDRLQLMKQEKEAPAVWWFVLPMVYLRQRDERQGKPWRLLQVWLLCTVLSVLIGNHFKSQSGTDRLAQSACPVVTKIMKRQGIEEHCIRVTDVKEEVKGRFYQAYALMNSGFKQPLTIEIRADNAIYVTLADEK